MRIKKWGRPKTAKGKRALCAEEEEREEAGYKRTDARQRRSATIARAFHARLAPHARRGFARGFTVAQAGEGCKG